MSVLAQAERIAGFAARLDVAGLPPEVEAVAGRQVLDVTGLCVAARGTPYIEALVHACEQPGSSALIGHAATRTPLEAALINGTAAHGEDFDDTFEGTPVHAGAVVVPAVLAACEQHGRDGADALKGIVAGVELMCRMALVAPTAIHRAGFHPTAVTGALGSALGVSAAIGLDARGICNALGIAGSLASGIIEYLAEGTWTKRLHAGWAAQSGMRAAALAGAGFTGPRTVFEGRHGFFHAFTNGDVAPDFGPLTDDLGSEWLMRRVAFKPYPCGTMTQPFIDCALRLRESELDVEEIQSIVCDVGEGTVHRLWEPLGVKQRPASPYAAKFSVPFCMAVAIVDGAVGLEQFAPSRIEDEAVLGLASRIGYRIDPENEYPANYSGHLNARLRDGSERIIAQPHLRGGAREPLSDAELRAKYRANARFGGWKASESERAETLLAELFAPGKPVDLSCLAL